MKDSTFYIFTHIPKTSGTSFLDRVVRATFADRAILGTSVQSFWQSFDTHHRVVTGHVGYGLHWLTARKAIYLTFLRHPIERAISHYYFIRQCNPALCKHDRYADAVNHSLAEFYRQPRYQNEMTRLLAGFPAERSAFYANTHWIDSLVYPLAKHRLVHHYDSFGLKERFEESTEYIASLYGWTSRPHRKQKKKTRGRPQVSDLDSATLRTLRDAHEYDLRLYDHACELLDARLSGVHESTDRRQPS